MVLWYILGMWTYSNVGESSGAGPSTSAGHPAHHPAVVAGAPPGTQPELTDFVQMFDQTGTPNFEDLNVFNPTNFE